MRAPNFFLLGAPKSGSTALYTYLFDHPQIFFPRLKEPRFFAKDFEDFREITDLGSYENLYAKVPDTARAIGDGSPWYLCSDSAIPEIRTYAPEARAVVILRNPLDMLPSLHNQFLFSFKEDETNLQGAWQKQDARLRGQDLPPSTPSPSLLQYGKLTRFGDQMERLIDQWPHHLIHVILFDDFKRDTRRVYEGVLDFLGLDDDGRFDFPIINEASQYKDPKIGWVFSSPDSPVSKAIRRLRVWTGFRSTGLLAPFYRGNRTPRGKVDLDQNFRLELIDFYRSDIAKLGQLINRDLSYWLS